MEQTISPTVRKRLERLVKPKPTTPPLIVHAQVRPELEHSVRSAIKMGVKPSDLVNDALAAYFNMVVEQEGARL